MWKIILYILLLIGSVSNARNVEKRSIDLIAAQAVFQEQKLPGDIVPNYYNLTLAVDPQKSSSFWGNVIINATVEHKIRTFQLHAHPDLIIESLNVAEFLPPHYDPSDMYKPSPSCCKIPMPEVTWKRVKMQPKVEIDLHSDDLEPGANLLINITFRGEMYATEGIFRRSYVHPLTMETKWYVATYLRPNYARNVFPCFDEPAYKVPIALSVIKPSQMKAVSNMPIGSSRRQRDADSTIDCFLPTPPMSTYNLALVVSELTHFCSETNDSAVSLPKTKIHVWARPDFMEALVNVSRKVATTFDYLEKFWGVFSPLNELNIFALPNFNATKPGDSWGVLMFKESELSSKGSWHLTQELVYQWLGALATPVWWNQAHINHALVRYITAYTTIQIGENETFSNWPTTMLYSIYYEFSKRHPHGKNTAIKQDSSSAKTELVFRMLNYTLGETTFRHGMQRLIADRQFKTFDGDDIWTSLTEQAHFDKTLPEAVTVNEIAGSWINKDRLPVVTVTRNYKNNSARLHQRLYLRERPHDVPDQDRFLWSIPIVLVRQDRMNFHNTTPMVWMMKEREIEIANLPDEKHFIIVNPEEIGPFPVNYDAENWKLLVEFLQTDERTKIPVYTRAKLLHDAWNLAYAGDLNITIALNMTLFLRNERDYLAWDPVFTMIDHIGKHIDDLLVCRQFEYYVKMLLTPLYEDLGEVPQPGESEGTTHLRNTAKIFLCQAGYEPCIDEANKEFHKWMESENPDEGNPVANQYICPVFKWRMFTEWLFGLERFINFPKTRKRSERTYLLKTLAGCPRYSGKIEYLLNLTLLQRDGNFSDSDLYLILSMLAGSSSGYNTLFDYLVSNWDEIKKNFADKPMLWNSIVASATGSFKSHTGLELVSQLYRKRQSEFGNADFIVEKSLRNIKVEIEWTDKNIPAMERWLLANDKE
ncbi:aminopeptidase N [Dendroctonus ponderosae]|uniref:aminopeptidase N n=1 Tax=Dendroctonus ponderosae TaxID=77166 RepID=UPI002035D4D5|nr:aminopeptidase N [Dendroctonus ponderosae]